MLNPFFLGGGAGAVAGTDVAPAGCTCGVTGVCGGAGCCCCCGEGTVSAAAGATIGDVNLDTGCDDAGDGVADVFAEASTAGT